MSFNLDPTSQAGKRWLDRFTSKFDSNLIVFGPLEGAMMPLRIPSHYNAQRAEQLGALAWSRMGTPGSNDENPFALSQEERDLAGGTWGMLATAGQDMSLSDQAVGEPAKQSVVALAVSNENPSTRLLKQLWGSTLWRRIQVWVALRYTFLLGFLGMLFLASLVVSPTAFVYERRVTAEREMERERERIRREANQRVFTRLEALSREVEQAGTNADADASEKLESAAHDIEATLVDLRRLLGDTNGKAGPR